MRAQVQNLLAALALLFSTATFGTTVTPASAAASAAAAVPSTAQVKSSVSLAEQQDKFGTYAPGSNEGLFAGGKGDATPQGTTRKAGCAGATNDPECWAIQSLQNARAAPTTWVPLNSPQLAGRNAVVADPAAVLGFDPAQVANAQSSVQCRTETITTPEVREENHCLVSTPNTAVNCSLGVEVIVDPDYVYKCLIRTATNSSIACSVGQVVTVDATTTYQCVERLRSNQANACRVDRIIEVDANTNYVCVNQVRQAVDTQCSVGTVVEVRADTNYQCVDQARTVANAACTVGQVVTIDPRFNYTCTNTPNQVTSNVCARKLTVTCAAGQCGGLSVTPVGLDPNVSFNVYADWPNTDLSTVILEFSAGAGTPAGGDFYYFEFDLVLTGTLNPVSFLDLAKMDAGSYFNVNGSTLVTIGGTYGYTGNTGAFRVGTNRIGVYYREVFGTGETPRINITLRGSYCQPPVCTDQWDESECLPYRVRL